jgi:dienelactone hydrolase
MNQRIADGDRMACTIGIVLVAAAGALHWLMPLLGFLLTLLAPAVAHSADRPLPETVYFASLDEQKTELVGYLFLPERARERHPAIVMLHGRAGPYSSKVATGCTRVGRGIQSPCGAATLSRRHAEWGRFWAERGYAALHVDSFGPRGKAHGFGRNTHDDPDRDDVNERTVRPMDAYGALAYLRTRPDVIPDRIGVQGWSNGGSTTLNVMGIYNPALDNATPETGFRAGMAFYPGCGKRALFDDGRYLTYAPLIAFLGGADEEVSPDICTHVLEKAQATGGSRVEFIVYPDATHNFDDPGEAHQRIEANHTATVAAKEKAEAFFRAALRP